MKFILRQKNQRYSLLTVSGKMKRRTSLVVQWLRLSSPNAGGMGLIPGHGTKIQRGVVGKKIRGKETDFYSEENLNKRNT